MSKVVHFTSKERTGAKSWHVHSSSRSSSGNSGGSCCIVVVVYSCQSITRTLCGG
jgi:hypothetical protein